MLLYYSPGACSLSPNIILHELGMAFDLVKVDLATKQTADGADFKSVNPKGYIPALRLDDGNVLTEGVVIVQYLADQKPEAGLLPPVGSLARARVQEMLNFTSAELHKSFTPLFNPDETEEGREAAKVRVAGRLDFIEATLADGRSWLTGDSFTPADSYAFVVMRWAPMQGISLDRWPRIEAWMTRVGDRPAVRAALAAE